MWEAGPLLRDGVANDQRPSSLSARSGGLLTIGFDSSSRASAASAFPAAHEGERTANSRSTPADARAAIPHLAQDDAYGQGGHCGGALDR